MTWLPHVPETDEERIGRQVIAAFEKGDRDMGSGKVMLTVQLPNNREGELMTFKPRQARTPDPEAP